MLQGPKEVGWEVPASDEDFLTQVVSCRTGLVFLHSQPNPFERVLAGKKIGGEVYALVRCEYAALTSNSSEASLLWAVDGIIYEWGMKAKAVSASLKLGFDSQWYVEPWKLKR